MIVKNMFSAAGVAFFALLTYAFVGSQTEVTPLKPGEKAAMLDRNMTDVSGEDVSLADVAGKRGLLVIFNSNLCPFVVGNGEKSEGWEGRYAEIHDLAAEAEIGMILVNSNEAMRDGGEGMDDMKEQYLREAYKGRYAMDHDHRLADAFGALVTPHVFLFDGDMNLVYTGTIDDSVNRSANVKSPYLKNAIRAVEKGEVPNPAVTRHLGCSIKRVKV